MNAVIKLFRQIYEPIYNLIKANTLSTVVILDIIYTSNCFVNVQECN